MCRQVMPASHACTLETLSAGQASGASNLIAPLHVRSKASDACKAAADSQRCNARRPHHRWHRNSASGQLTGHAGPEESQQTPLPALHQLRQPVCIQDAGRHSRLLKPAPSAFPCHAPYLLLSAAALNVWVQSACLNARSKQGGIQCWQSGPEAEPWLEVHERRAYHALPRPRSQNPLERTAERSTSTKTGCSSHSMQRAKPAAVSAVSTCSAPTAPRSHAGRCLRNRLLSAGLLHWQIWLASRLFGQLQPYGRLMSPRHLAEMCEYATVSLGGRQVCDCSLIRGAHLFLLSWTFSGPSKVALMELASLRQRPLLLGPLLLLNRGATIAGATRISPSMPCACQHDTMSWSLFHTRWCDLRGRALHAALSPCGAIKEFSVQGVVHAHMDQSTCSTDYTQKRQAAAPPISMSACVLVLYRLLGKSIRGHLWVVNDLSSSACTA